MKCDHPQCNGRHRNGISVALLCPAAIEKKRARDRSYYYRIVNGEGLRHVKYLMKKDLQRRERSIEQLKEKTGLNL